MAVVDLVDEVNALERTLRLERPFDERRGIGGVEAQRDFHAMRAGGAIGDGEKPHHERMRDGKLVAPDVGEDAQDRVLARCRVDVDAVARDPDEQLRLGLHGPKMGGWRGAGQSFW